MKTQAKDQEERYSKIISKMRHLSDADKAHVLDVIEALIRRSKTPRPKATKLVPLTLDSLK